MGHFTEIDSFKLEEFLQGLGFAREVLHNEIVYERKHNLDPRMVIKCFTSIATGENVARSCGEDAIRIVAVFVGKEKTYPLFKGKKILRTTSQESVQERVLERCRAAYDRCNKWRKEQREKNSSFKFGANR